MFQVFEAKQLRDVASVWERTRVVWTLNDSGLTPLLCVSQVWYPRAMATSETLSVEVFVCNAGEERIWGGLGGVSAGCWAGSLPQDGKARSCLGIKGQRLWFLNMPFWQTLHLLDEESVSFNVKHKWSLGNVLKGRTLRLKIICSKYSVRIYKQWGTANNSTAGWSSVIPESIYGSY